MPNYILKIQCGARLQLAALYYVLNKQGHIAQKLMATQIAALFDSWLSHHISKDSFVKAFQSEQQDALTAVSASRDINMSRIVSC